MSNPIAYYNEIDPRAAAWMRELINQGHIAPGDVDERDMRDVTPDELAGYAQCHFFAGIGVWSYALRRAGWPDDRPVWTGSCPCQPFSQAGAKGGFDDERHLWPAWQWLIDQRRPVALFGEQVANGNVDPWIDLVQADVEGMDYAFGCVPLPAAGVGSPNIRDRAFWMAHAAGGGFGEFGHALVAGGGGHVDRRIVAGGLADPTGIGGGTGLCDRGPAEQRRSIAANDGGAHRLGHTSGAGHQGIADGRRDVHRPSGSAIERAGRESAGPMGHNGAPPTDGFWRDADWLLCRDGKWRPVEPGTFPLANGAPARVGRLRGYGNAINAEVATHFIREAMTLIDGAKAIAA